MRFTFLAEHKDNPIWQEPEETGLIYDLPFQNSLSRLRDISIQIAQNLPTELISSLGEALVCASPETHVGPFLHALDILIPDGTEVLASQDGTVKCVVDFFNNFGDNPEFSGQLNYITILHPNNEMSQYCHLMQNSATNLGMIAGMKVKKGQKIGIVGKSGWTNKDHLHFIVQRDDFRLENPFKFKSLKIRFSCE